MADHRHFHNS